MANNCKILISYKEKHKILKSDILTPIQTGRAIADEIFEDMIGDDTGENISLKNNLYSELSAIYWVWKNYGEVGNPEYIGHMQYRRHFILNEKFKNTTKTSDKDLLGYSTKVIHAITNSYIEDIGLDDITITNTLKDIDIIVVKKANMKYLGCKNAKEDFLKNVPSARYTDYDLLINTVKKMYPEYINAIDELDNLPYRYFYHMFIMKKELFFEYMNFMFDILFTIEPQLDSSGRGSRGGRVLGYLGEFLLSLFIFKKYSENKKIKEFYASLIQNSQEEKLSISVHDKIFVYYINNIGEINNLAVSIRSICKNIDSLYNVKFLIYYDNISKYDIQNIKLKIGYDNLLSFYRISTNDEIPEVFKNNIILSIFYRLKDFENVTYVSNYCIFNKSFSIDKLFPCNVNAFLYTNIYADVPQKEDYKTYYEDILGLENAYKYFSDKVINCRCKSIDFNIISKNLEKMPVQIYKNEDILNYIFSKDVHILPSDDLIFSNFVTLRKYFNADEYINAIDNAKIIYRDNLITIENILSKSIYVKYATFEILLDAKDHDIYQIFGRCFKIHIQNIINFNKNILKYWKYKFLKNFVWGETKERYVFKKQLYKDKIRNARLFIK